MKVVVFLGPSLAVAEARSILSAEYRAPASQGDVYRAARDGATAIALIDGVFERVPSVWHKEVLWALSRGVHVWGAASMGALRAAELCSFGMVGVGEIFERYRDGTLSADDAVAVAHAAPEHDHRALSIALVDVEYASEMAARAGLLDAADVGNLIDCGRKRFFADRRWPSIIGDAVAEGLDPAKARRFQDWLSVEPRSLKANDARALLAALAAFAPKAAPFQPSFRFEHTDAWDSFVHDEEARGDAFGSLGDELLTHLAAALERDGTLDDALAGAAILALATAQAQKQNVSFDEATLRNAETHLRTRLGLEDDAELQAWKEARGLDEVGFRRLVTQVAARAWFLGVLAPEATRHLLDHIHMQGGALPERPLGSRDAMIEAGRRRG